MAFSVSQATKVALAGTLALTGVLGASFVGVSQGETTLNQAQAAEVNEVSAVNGIEGISFKEQTGKVTTGTNFYNEVTFTITEDVKSVASNGVKIEHVTPTVNGEEKIANIIGIKAIEVDGEEIGRLTSSGIVFNEFAKNHIGEEVTVSYTVKTPTNFKAKVKGEYDVPVITKVNGQVADTSEYTINATKLTTNQNILNNATNRTVSSGTLVGTIDSNNNYNYKNQFNLGIGNFKEGKEVSIKVTTPEGVNLQGVPEVGQSTVTQVGKVESFGNTLENEENLVFTTTHNNVLSKTTERVDEDTVVYTLAPTSNYDETLMGGLVVGNVSYSVEEGAYTTKQQGKWLQGRLVEGVVIESPELGYSYTAFGGNIK